MGRGAGALARLAVLCAPLVGCTPFYDGSEYQTGGAAGQAGSGSAGSGGAGSGGAGSGGAGSGGAGSGGTGSGGMGSGGTGSSGAGGSGGAGAECGVVQVANVALKKPATASSTFQGYSAANVTDGVTSTAINGGWANDLQPYPQWVEVDLQQSKQVNRIHIFTSSKYPVLDYDLEYWDGTSFQPLVQVRGNGKACVVSSFATRTTSKLRFVGLNGPVNQPSHVRVNELEAFAE